MGNIVLVTGGVRSGKSVLAEKLASTHGAIVYIATCEVRDEEMAERIRLHQERRPGHWKTAEAPLDLMGAAQQDDTSCLLIDCLGLWVTNCLLANEDRNLANPSGFMQEMREKTRELLELLSARQGNSILVTNEVGFGLVPPYKMGRVFRDCLGIVNATAAEAARDVYLCTVGLPVALKKDGVNRLG